MPLVLTVVRQPEGSNLTETRKLFSEAGGTLGRSADNTWSLPDPSRFVSSHHASIRYDHGDFYLVDTSTNGVYVNASSSPLGTGNQVRLQQGDKLYLGEYEIHVEFEQAGNEPANMSNDDFDQWLSPEPADAVATGGDANDLLTPEQELLDPLAALDKASGSSNQHSWQGASQADNASVPDQAFVPPNPIPESQQPSVNAPSSGGGVIPDDWDIDDLLGDEPPASSPAAEPMASPFEEAAPAEPKPVIPENADLASDIDALLEDPGEGVVTPEENPAAIENNELDAFLGIDSPGDDAAADPSISQPAVSQPEPPAPPQPEPQPVIPEPAKPAAPTQPPSPQVPESLIDNNASQPVAQASAPVSADGCDELIRSLGLDPTRMNPQTRKHFQKILADTLRETVGGMMKVLGARNAIKNEFRMNVTMIQPVENNPLKFSPNVDEALRNMFTSESNAYLPGTAAIREGFQDIADHQVAVIAGMRAAFRSLLKRFDPEDLQVRFDKQHQAGFLSSKKGMYWEAYQELYKDLSDNMDDAFQDLFGEDFAEAYEQQMARLEASRKK